MCCIGGVMVAQWLGCAEKKAGGIARGAGRVKFQATKNPH